MSRLNIGDKLQIECYKHDGSVHRSWDEAVILDIKRDYIVCGNNRTLVTEVDGNKWKTKEPAIMYFFTNKWFNIISQLKKDGIYYYCNIATPFIIEDGKIKYIDYDLDLRVFPTGEYKILDRLEYKYHKKKMHYSDDLDIVVRGSLDDLIKYYEHNWYPFNEKNNKNYYEKYRNCTELR